MKENEVLTAPQTQPQSEKSIGNFKSLNQRPILSQISSNTGRSVGVIPFLDLQLSEELQKSRATIAKSVENDITSPQPWWNLIHFYHAKCKLSQQQLILVCEKALSKIDHQANADNPAYAKLLLAQCKFYYETQKFDVALDIYKSMYKNRIGRNLYYFYLNYASLLHKVNRTGKAIELLQFAMNRSAITEPDRAKISHYLKTYQEEVKQQQAREAAAENESLQTPSIKHHHHHQHQQLQHQQHEVPMSGIKEVPQNDHYQADPAVMGTPSSQPHPLFDTPVTNMNQISSFSRNKKPAPHTDRPKEKVKLQSSFAGHPFSTPQVPTMPSQFPVHQNHHHHESASFPNVMETPIADHHKSHFQTPAKSSQSPFIHPIQTPQQPETQSVVQKIDVNPSQSTSPLTQSSTSSTSSMSSSSSASLSSTVSNSQTEVPPTPSTQSGMACNSNNNANGAAANIKSPTNDENAVSQTPKVQKSNPEVPSSVSREEASSESTTKKSSSQSFLPEIVIKKNRYFKIGYIGQGGSSKVVKALCNFTTDDRKKLETVAIKIVDLSTQDEQARRSFENEVELLSRLQGKNTIVQMYDYEISKSSVLYVVLEIGEIDLRQLLGRLKKQGKQINHINYIRLYWQQMLEAVNTIHEERIVHGDLKPANFVMFKGVIKLIDFGIASAIQSDTTNIKRDSMIGTLNYIAPEALEISGEIYKLGTSSDVWSLGIILYEMIYHTTPFSSIQNIMQKVQTIVSKSSHISYPPVPEYYNEALNVVKRCLNRNPKERPTIPQLLVDEFLAQ